VADSMIKASSRFSNITISPCACRYGIRALWQTHNPVAHP